MNAIYYQSIGYIFRIHKFKVIIKIQGGSGEGPFFFLEECQAINVNGTIELEKSPRAVPSDLGIG